MQEINGSPLGKGLKNGQRIVRLFVGKNKKSEDAIYLIRDIM